ncbi:MAG TPA: glycerol-3-phosphate dehydrogenase [Noviherbaspirillum sp.]|nr:glycerol-3-phosphate dehydrogenase [Noviherbaspirillum sp.]
MTIHRIVPKSGKGAPATAECDVLVVGGGINGAGIARDLAGRGMSVVLCEQNDLAAHTSSSSSKLIHGGLRYLEHHEFNLVRKALIEREVLLRSAPHIMRPLQFVMPHDKGQRPAWLLRAGLFLYDHLARRELLPGSFGINLHEHAAGVALKKEFTKAFVYSDGWVDDARLVVFNAIDAADRGAQILTRTACEWATRYSNHWVATLRGAAGQDTTVKARSLVNAAGPWATRFLKEVAQQPSKKSVRLIKGSHIVVPKLFEHPYAYIFQHTDGRIVFAIPYEENYTLIGTTDVEHMGSPGSVQISREEIEYLCALCARYFEKSISPADVVWSYSGVRPLLEDSAANASAVTRDYQIELNTAGAPLLSVFGGKITTYRKLAEEAAGKIADVLGNSYGHWTEKACLPGGDLYGPNPSNQSVLEFEAFTRHMMATYPWIPPSILRRYIRSYGTRTHMLLAGRHSLAGLGDEIAQGLYAAEVEYWMQHEWATTAADMLWRRSKLGLHLPRNTEQVLDAWIADRVRPAVQHVMSVT